MDVCGRLAGAVWKADIDTVVAMHACPEDREHLAVDERECLCYEYAAMASKFTASDMLEVARLSGCKGVGLEAVYTACALGDVGKLEILHTIDAQRPADERQLVNLRVYAVMGMWELAAESASIDVLVWLREKYPSTAGCAAALRAASRTHGENSQIYNYTKCIR